MKHRECFPEFFELMLRDMDAAQEEKGDSWLDDNDTVAEHPAKDIKTRESMHSCLMRELEDKFHNFMEMGNIKHLPALANYCAMIYMRAILKVEEDGKK